MFLLVIRLDVRFTKEEKSSVKWIKENFGDEASKYTAVLFTRGDQFKETSIENYLEQSPDLKELIAECKAGYVVFDNTCKKNRTQVADLFEKINQTVQLNGNHYTSSKYEEAQKQMNWNKWWRKCGDTLNSAGNYLLVAGVAGAAAAAPAVGAAVMAEEAAVASVRPLLMFVGAGIVKSIGAGSDLKQRTAKYYQATTFMKSLYEEEAFVYKDKFMLDIIPAVLNFMKIIRFGVRFIS